MLKKVRKWPVKTPHVKILNFLRGLKNECNKKGYFHWRICTVQHPRQIIENLHSATHEGTSTPEICTLPVSDIMTTQDLKPILRKCKRLVLEGQRGQTLADSLGISKRTAHNYIRQLEFMGELKDITGNSRTTPRIYEDGRARVCYNSEFAHLEDPTQTGKDNPQLYEVSKRVVPTTPNLHTEGTPSKCVRFHCTGCYDVPVVRLGDHAGRITDNNGLTIGEWSDIANCNGSRRQYGRARLYPEEDLKFTLFYCHSIQNGNDGKKVKTEYQKITVTPNPRDVYYKSASKIGPQLLEEQVNRLLDVLTINHGWVFLKPVWKGTYHYALTSPDLAPLLKLADRNIDVEGGPAVLHVDTSEGSPELEFYATADGDQEIAQEGVNNIYELPAQIANIKQSVSEIYGTLRIMASSIGELTKITAELIKTQAQTVEATAQAQIKTFDGVGYQ